MDASPVASASATVPESAPKATPLDMRVWLSPPMMIVPVVDRDVVQHLVNDVRHRVVDALRITRR
jgi:hypothetical protein